MHIGFSRPTEDTLISRAIRLVERTPYSHVYVRFYSENLDRHLCFHANIDNVHFLRYSKFLKKNTVIEEFEIELNPEQKKKAMQFCIDRAAIRYGTTQLIGMGIIRLVRAWFGIKIKNPFADKERRQVCSELVGYLLSHLGYPIDTTALETEGPAFIYKFCQEICKKN